MVEFASTQARLIRNDDTERAVNLIRQVAVEARFARQDPRQVAAVLRMAVIDAGIYAAKHGQAKGSSDVWEIVSACARALEGGEAVV